MTIMLSSIVEQEKSATKSKLEFFFLSLSLSECFFFGGGFFGFMDVYERLGEDLV